MGNRKDNFSSIDCTWRAAIGLGLGLFSQLIEAGTFEAILPNPVGVTGPYDVSTFALSSDGHYVVYFFTDGTIRRWDIRETDAALKDKVLLTTHPKGTRPDFRRPPGLAVSGDGRFIAFQAKPEELDDSQAATNRYDIYLWDSNTNFDPTSPPVTLSVNGGPANGSSTSPTMTHDGRFVAFTSQATNLTLDAIDSGRRHIFVYDRQSGKTTLASANRSGLPSNGDSDWPAIAQPEPGVDAGHVRVAFQSDSSDLIEGDFNEFPDIFVYDNRATPKIYLVSQGIDGASQPSNYVDIQPTFGSLALPPTISGNGKVVAFASSSSNLVADDSNGTADVFVRNISDLAHGVTSLVSLTNDGLEGNDGGTVGSSGTLLGRIGLSDDGSLVSFPSTFPEIAFPAKADLVIRDTVKKVTVPVGNKAGIATFLGGAASQLSADGTILVTNRDVGGDYFVTDSAPTFDPKWPDYKGLHVFHNIPQPVGALVQVVPSGRDPIPNEAVTLDASASHAVQPNADATLRYRWELVTQPGNVVPNTVIEEQQDQLQFTLTPPVAGYYQVRMTVNDGIQDGVPKLADLMVKNANGNVPPMARTTGTGSWVRLKDANGEQFVPGANVGSWLNWVRGNTSYDPDNMPGTGLTYRWVAADKFSRSARLRAKRTDQLQFKPARFGIYRFNLIVSDGVDKSVAATQEVYTTPVVDVTTPSDTQVGQTIELSMECQNAPEPKRLVYFVSKDDGRHWIKVGRSKSRTLSWKVGKRFVSDSARFKACSSGGATYRPICAISGNFAITPAE